MFFNVCGLEKGKKMGIDCYIKKEIVLKYKITSLKKEKNNIKEQKLRKIQMENTEGIWILSIIVLILYFFTEGHQAATPGKHGIKRETDNIHQPKYFQNPLTLKQVK